MHEDFLSFLWQSQYFDKNNLCTAQGEALQVLSVGYQNTNAGPDFADARLLMGQLEWAGAVEIHVKASDWHRHAHTHNRAYDGVILHLVWENDQAILRPDGTLLPTLELKTRTDGALRQKYQDLVQHTSPIACAAQIETVSELSKISMLDRALMQRLESKALLVRDLYANNNNDWEETAYQVLAQNFGFKINAEPFLRLAQGLPFKVLQKHRNNLTQIEALLFGQAGFLENPEDDYAQTLAKEYHFLATKYNLQPNQVQQHEWKFLRLRPANFPTVRLAQLAALLQQQSSLFSLFVNTNQIGELAQNLVIKPSAYWQKHYQFGKESGQKIGALGRGSVENIAINTVVPLLVAYSKHKDEPSFLEQATELLESIAPEKNHIVEQWQALGIPVKSAFDSQAVIELYNRFCTPKKCLTCAIGVALVRGQ